MRHSRAGLYVAILSCACAVAARGESPTAAPSYGVYVNSPFHPDECAAARNESERQLAAQPESTYWRRVRAEAELCRLLERNDPRALRLLLEELRRLTRRAPDDLHAAIALADVQRRLYPASPEAVAALRQALSLVPGTGSALRAYLEGNRVAVEVSHAGCRRQNETARRFSDVCRQQGLVQEERALRLLTRDPRRAGDRAAWLRDRAEIRYHTGRPAAAVSALRRAAALSRAAGRDEAAALIDARLAEIESTRTVTSLSQRQTKTGGEQ